MHEGLVGKAPLDKNSFKVAYYRLIPCPKGRMGKEQEQGTVPEEFTLPDTLHTISLKLHEFAAGLLQNSTKGSLDLYLQTVIQAHGLAALANELRGRPEFSSEPDPIQTESVQTDNDRTKAPRPPENNNLSSWQEEILRKLGEEGKIRQADLARLVGITPNYFSVFIAPHRQTLEELGWVEVEGPRKVTYTAEGVAFARLAYEEVQGEPAEEIVRKVREIFAEQEPEEEAPTPIALAVLVRALEISPASLEVQIRNWVRRDYITLHMLGAEGGVRFINDVGFRKLVEAGVLRLSEEALEKVRSDSRALLGGSDNPLSEGESDGEEQAAAERQERYNPQAKDGLVNLAETVAQIRAVDGVDIEIGVLGRTLALLVERGTLRVGEELVEVGKRLFIREEKFAGVVALLLENIEPGKRRPARPAAEPSGNSAMTSGELARHLGISHKMVSHAIRRVERERRVYIDKRKITKADRRLLERTLGVSSN